MRSRNHLRTSTGALCFVLAFSGCSHDPASSQTVPPCSTDPTAIFLHSKLDDDDGDGNLYDEDFPRIDDEDDDIADHAWIDDRRGLHHLFFQNEGKSTGSRIEHYVTADFRDLSYVGVALEPSPGAWDLGGLWAPHIVAAGGSYFMFYTGVSGRSNDPRTIQRIGLAVSTDLRTWTRVPLNRCPGTTGDGCIYECRECWTMAGEPAQEYNRQCRDPFVVWDERMRRWVLFATAKSTNGAGVVTVAYGKDLTQWRGAGYLDATRRLSRGTQGQLAGGQAENPCVFAHGGRFVLLFTDWLDPEDDCSVANPRTMVQWANSTTLTADSLGSANWVYRGYTSDPGVNAIEVQKPAPDTWIATQSISNRHCPDYEGHRRELRLRRIVWRTDGSFVTEPWQPPRRAR